MDKIRKILYLYTGDHPAHRKFAEVIGADIREMSWDIPKGYDIYFTEGEFFKPIVLRMFGKLSKSSKIINLFSDPRLFYLDRKISFNVRSGKIEKKSKIKTILFKILMNKLEGVICVGKFQESLLKKYYSGPFKKVDVFIEENFHEKLLKIKPKLVGRKILFIGHGPDVYTKGVDLLVEIARKNKDIEFTIVGGHYKRFIEGEIIPENVKFVGKLKSFEMCELFKDNSLYVHLGRGEAFGIVILESMAAGLPCIVSGLTGAKEAVGKVDPDFIVPLNEEVIGGRIKDYFDKSLVERKVLSGKFRERSRFYNEKEQLENFKQQFEKLSNELF